mmetsp:Transcript_17745/g.46836  ORF Transcript_17745/g.46836 Transcript_17745/m.46836 type:complete len:296 (-) Transcript_17745:811-1698(-)
MDRVLPLRLGLDHGDHQCHGAFPDLLLRHQLVLHEEGRAPQDGGAELASLEGHRGNARVPHGQHLPRRGDRAVVPPGPALQLDRRRGGAGRGRGVRRGLHRPERDLQMPGRCRLEVHRRAQELLHARLLQVGRGAPLCCKLDAGRGQLPVLQERLQRRHHPLPALHRGLVAVVPADQQVHVLQAVHSGGEGLPDRDRRRRHEHRHHLHAVLLPAADADSGPRGPVQLQLHLRPPRRLLPLLPPVRSLHRVWVHDALRPHRRHAAVLLRVEQEVQQGQRRRARGRLPPRVPSRHHR